MTSASCVDNISGLTPAARRLHFDSNVVAAWACSRRREHGTRQWNLDGGLAAGESDGGLHDGGEVLDLEAGAADQGAVDVRLRE